MPVATGLVVRAGGVDVDLPGRGWVVVPSGAVLLLGVVAGGPLLLASLLWAGTCGALVFADRW